ncbi:MAG: carbohydrate kinase family protein [Anaerolineae bacterium]|nr:carbohydrate kinase family protein [Anaerolineae bacterium]
MKPRIVNIGDLVIDLIAPVHLPIVAFDHQESNGIRLEPGGGCNFVLMAQRLGAQIIAVGAVGADSFGGELLDILRAEGVDTRGVDAPPGSTSTLVLDLIDLAQQKHVFIGGVATGPVMAYSPAIDALVAEGQALFCQGYNLHEKRLVEVLPAALDRAVANGIPVYFDSGPTIRHFGYDQILPLIQRTTCLMMTEEELPLAADGRSGAEAYAFLLANGPEMVVVKQGPAGCTLVTAEGSQSVPGFRVAVKDTVGAGDCFDAAFLYGRLSGLEPVQAARLANATGAASVQKVGAGRAVPTRAEVQAVLDQAGDDLRVL